MRRLSTLAVVTLVLTLARPFAPPVATQGPAYYTLDDLGAVNGAPYAPRAINSAGHIVGWFMKTDGLTGAFLYTTGPQPVELPAGAVVPLDATAINSTGAIAGSGRDALGQTVAMRYTDATGAVGLGLLDLDSGAGLASYAYGINGRGDVVGYSGDFTSHAIRYTDATGLEDLGTLAGGSVSYAYGINDAGTVTGCASDVNGYHRAFVTSGPGGLQDIGTLGGTNSCGLAINLSGQVSGWAARADGASEAFLYQSGGPMQGLGTMGFHSSVAMGLNDSGLVVGYVTATDWSQRAFLYSSQDGMIDLNSRIDPALGWTLDQAIAVNNAGQIVGLGRVGGEIRGFRLTPPSQPEPEPAPKVDATPPTIERIGTNTPVLWPPLGQMVRVKVLVKVSDDTDPAPACRITRVVSDQVDSRRRFKQQPDIQIVGDLSVRLRAELLPPKHHERTYTITVACADQAGNASSAHTKVRVVRLPPWIWHCWR